MQLNKRAEQRAKELGQPAQLYYLSFSKPKEEGGWQGAAIVPAHGPATALDRCNELGINPGGAAVILPWPAPTPHELTDRLLTRAEMEATFGELGPVPKTIGTRVCRTCGELHEPGVH